jgi:hypothetical protein
MKANRTCVFGCLALLVRLGKDVLLTADYRWQAIALDWGTWYGSKQNQPVYQY